MKSYVNKLPKTTTHWKEDGVHFVKHTSFFITEEEGIAVSDLINDIMSETDTYAVVIDNREAKGAWPQNITEILNKNASYMKNVKKKKSVTLTNSAVTTMQMNRTIKSANLEDVSKAFNCDFNEEVKAFLKS